MPYAIAHLLDWGNDRLVESLLRGSQVPPDADAIHRYLGSPPEPMFPATEQLPPFVPARVGGADSCGKPLGRRVGWLPSEEIWEAAAPWPDVVEPNARWIASRVPARGRHGRARKEPGEAPAVLLLHGWLAARIHMGHYLRLAWLLSRRGVEVWIPRLPFHIERTPAGTFSGALCLSADLVSNAEAMRQAVSEIRALADWLRGQGSPTVGLWGTSLGGWVAGLAATVGPDWEAVALWAPVASAQQVLWEAGLVGEIRDAVRRAGIDTLDDARWTLRLSLVERRLMIDPQRVFLAAGIHDKVVFPRSISELAHAWGVGIQWRPHGHISLMASIATTRATVEYFDRILAPAS